MITSNLKWMASLLVILILGCLFYISIKNGELGQKSKFALLQSVEYKYRNVPEVKKRLPILLMPTKDRTFSILGVPLVSDSGNYFWIILDDEEPGNELIKSIPKNADFVLSCSYLSILRDKVHVSTAVNNFLSKKCRDG